MTLSKARRAKRPQGPQGVFQGTVLMGTRGGMSLASCKRLHMEHHRVIAG